MIDSPPDITDPKTFALFAVLMIFFGCIIGFATTIVFTNTIVPQPCGNTVPLIQQSLKPSLIDTTPKCYGHITTLQGVEIILALVVIGAIGAIALRQIPRLVNIITGRKEDK